MASEAVEAAAQAAYEDYIGWNDWGQEDKEDMFPSGSGWPDNCNTYPQAKQYRSAARAAIKALLQFAPATEGQTPYGWLSSILND